MTLEELAIEVASLKLTVADLQGRIAELEGGPKSNWLPHVLGRFADYPEFDEAMAYGKYFRITGSVAPPDWKPGDPIPEPEWE